MRFGEGDTSILQKPLMSWISLFSAKYGMKGKLEKKENLMIFRL